MTLVADAGVGKSRLMAEFLDRIADRAFTLQGRCLPYGDGITFWPLAEALKSACGIVNDDSAEPALAKLASLADAAGAGVTERLAAMIGLRPEPFPMEELAWAVRRFLEHAATERPVVARRRGRPLGGVDAPRADRAARRGRSTTRRC